MGHLLSFYSLHNPSLRCFLVTPGFSLPANHIIRKAAGRFENRVVLLSR